MANLPKHNMKALTSSGAVSATACVVYAILLVPAGVAGTIKLTNDADGSGTAVLTDQAAANGNGHYISFEDIGGVRLASKCYATLSGTGAVVYIWYD